MGVETEPLISVVIVPPEGGGAVSLCLDSLAHQTLRQGVEILLVEASYHRRDLPARVGAAIRKAQGCIVVVTGGQCVFPEDWLRKVLNSHDANPEVAVIGGALEYGGGSLSSWAAFFADYGPFLPPAPRRETSTLAGTHVSYKRGVLGHLKGDYWKVFFHAELESRGTRFLFDPELVMTWKNTESFLAFARRYYRNGSAFAAMRCEHLSMPGRLLRLLTTPTLPALLLYRRLAAVWGMREYRTRLLLTIPWLAMLVVSWSAGECAGYFSGSSGIRK